MPKNKALLRIVFLMMAVALIAGACKPKEAQASPQEVPTVEIPTPTPIPPDRAVLIAPADADGAMVAQAQAILAELTAASGLQFETRAEINENTLTPDVKIVVFLNHPDNLGTLAARAAGTQFVAISSLDWTPPANVTLIRKQENDAAFLAGYAAAILAPNFRVGALLTAEETASGSAFQNGVGYYCGTCSAQINPLNSYPIVSVQSAGSAPEIWQAAFDQINTSKVNVLYIDRGAMSAQLLSYLAGKDVAVIANQAPPDESFANWAGSIYLDTLSPLREIWNDLMAGTGGKIINAAYTITDNHQIALTDGTVWLSPGKLRLLDDIIALLRSNQINTQTVN